MSSTSGTIIAAAIVPSDTNDTYPTHHAEYGKGGHRSVTTLIKRDAIAVDKREIGMTVYVAEDDTTYTFKDGIENINWEIDKRGTNFAIVQAVGNSEDDVMSQKAVSTELARIDTTVDTFGNSLLDKGFRISALEQKNVIIEEELSTTGSKVLVLEDNVGDLEIALAELLENMPAPSDENFTTILKEKLDGIAALATKNNTDAYLTSRANHTGTQAMSTILLLAEEFAKKVDKISGKGLSTNDYTNEEKQKLANVQDYFKGGFNNQAAILAEYPAPQMNNIYTLNYETTSFWYYKDGQWVDSENVSTGDMLAAIYDPSGKRADAYSMDNMNETATKKVMTNAERLKLSELYTKVALDLLLAAKQNSLVSGESLKTLNGQSLLGQGNLEIDPVPVEMENYYNKIEVDDKIANVDALPNQFGSEGKFLYTDGSNASWKYPGEGVLFGGTKIRSASFRKTMSATGIPAVNNFIPIFEDTALYNSIGPTLAINSTTCILKAGREYKIRGGHDIQTNGVAATFQSQAIFYSDEAGTIPLATQPGNTTIYISTHNGLAMRFIALNIIIKPTTDIYFRIKVTSNSYAAADRSVGAWLIIEEDEEMVTTLVGLTELPSPKLGIEVLTASRHPVTGKPIYSKTVDCGFLANTANGLTITPVNVPVSTDHMQVIAESSSVVIPGTGNFSFGVHMPWYTLASQIGAYIEDGSIVIGVGSPQGNKRAYVTVQYTKTSDTSSSPAALIGGRGMSLYEHWLSVGNSGTEEEFVEDMKGKITTDILTSEQLAQLNGRLLAFGQFGYKNITAVEYTIGTTKIPVFTTRKIGELIATNDNQFTLKANVTYFLDFNISASPVTNELDVSIINDLDSSVILNKDVSTLTITSSGTYFTPTIDTPISLRITSHNNTTSGTVTTAILDSGIKITEYSTVDLKISRLTINGSVVDENNNVDLHGVGNMASPKLNVEVLTEYRHPVSSKPIYAKTINFGALPNSTTKTVLINIADTIDTLWVDPTFSHGSAFPVPSSYFANSDGYTMSTSTAAKSITAKTNGTYSGHSAYVTVRYTKTADTAASPIRLVGGNTIL